MFFTISTESASRNLTFCTPAKNGGIAAHTLLKIMGFTLDKYIVDCPLCIQAHSENS